MTSISKRALIRFTGLASIAAAAALVGCGKKEEAPAPAAEPAAAAAPAKPEPLKIAFAYVGPVGDAGWTFAHDNARKAVQQEFGDKIETSFVEKVPESADAERVMRDMVSQGNKLIFGTTFGYMEPMLKVAADNKDVQFEHATGYTPAEHLRTHRLQRQNLLERQRADAFQRLVQRRPFLAVQHRVVGEVRRRIGLIGGHEIDERLPRHWLQRVIRAALLANRGYRLLAQRLVAQRAGTVSRVDGGAVRKRQQLAADGVI